MNTVQLQAIALREVEPLFTAAEWSDMRSHDVDPATLHLLAFYKALDTGLESKTSAVSLLKSVTDLDAAAERGGKESPGYLFTSVKVRMDAHEMSKHFAASEVGAAIQAALE